MGDHRYQAKGEGRLARQAVYLDALLRPDQASCLNKKWQRIHLVETQFNISLVYKPLLEQIHSWSAMDPDRSLFLEVVSYVSYVTSDSCNLLKMI